MLFASDCPFDKEKGPGYIRDTIKVLESIGLSGGRQGEDLLQERGTHVRAGPRLSGRAWVSGGRKLMRGRRIDPRWAAMASLMAWSARVRSCRGADARRRLSIGHS